MSDDGESRVSGVVRGPSSRLDLRVRRRARCLRRVHSTWATLIVVGVAMHDAQVKDWKMTKLTSIVPVPNATRSSSAARHPPLCARRPRSTFSLVVVAVVAVVDEPKQALRGRGGAEEARGRRR